MSDLAASLAFWSGLLGFAVACDRPAGGAYLERDGAQAMLCLRNGNWDTGPLDRPFGQGTNRQITVRALAPILAALDAAGWPLFRPVQESWYRVGAEEGGQREFLVQDPGGTLLRFAGDIGVRPAR